MTTPQFILNLREKIGHDMLMLPGVTAVVINEAHEILLEQRSDSGLWALPSGIMEPGEEPAAAIVREVWEETGVQVIPERIVGVFTGPDYLVTYPNEDQVMFIDITFYCRPVSGEPHAHDDETLQARYFPLDALPELEAYQQVALAQALRNDPHPFFYLSKPQDKANACP